MRDVNEVFTEDDTHRRCTQSQCAYYRMGGCQPCKVCSSDSFILKKDCDTCYKCENVPNACRFGEDNNIEIEQTESENKIEEPMLLGWD